MKLSALKQYTDFSWNKKGYIIKDRILPSLDPAEMQIRVTLVSGNRMYSIEYILDHCKIWCL